MDEEAKANPAAVKKHDKGKDSDSQMADWEIIESATEDDGEPEDLSDLSVRVGIFTCFWTSGMFGNLDTGVIPTTLHQIMEELNITQGETAFLASVCFLATAVGSIFVSPLTKHF